MSVVFVLSSGRDYSEEGDDREGAGCEHFGAEQLPLENRRARQQAQVLWPNETGRGQIFARDLLHQREIRGKQHLYLLI